MNNSSSSHSVQSNSSHGAGPRRTLTNERNREVGMLPIKPAENMDTLNIMRKNKISSITKQRLNAVKYSQNVAKTQKKVVNFNLDDTNPLLAKYKEQDITEKCIWWSNKGKEEDKSMQVRIGLFEQQHNKHKENDDESIQTHNSAVFSVHPEYTAQSKWQSRPSDTNIHWSYFNVVKAILLRENLILKLHVLLINMDKAYWVYGAYRIKYAEIITLNKDLLESTYLALQQTQGNTNTNGNNTNTNNSNTNSNSNGNKPIPISMASINVTKEINAMKEKCFHSREQLLEIQAEFTVAMAHLRSISLSVVENILCWRNIAQKEKPTNELLSLIWNGDNYLVKMLTDVLFITSNHIYKPPHMHHILPTPVAKVKLQHLQHLHATSDQFNPLAIAKQNASASTRSSPKSGTSRRSSIANSNSQTSQNSQTANSANTSICNTDIQDNLVIPIPIGSDSDSNGLVGDSNTNTNGMGVGSTGIELTAESSKKSIL